CRSRGVCQQTIGITGHAELDMREGGFCARLFQAARKSLILNGEMSEWLKEHAWKSTPPARADAHQIPPRHFRSTTSRNNDLLQRVLVNDGVAPGFRGVCDTVLTQNGFVFLGKHNDAYAAVHSIETTLELDHQRGLENGIELVLPRARRADHDFRSS